VPHYKFFCHQCKKLFAKILSLVNYEEGETHLPALWQQGRRTALVCLPPSTSSKERVTTKSETGCTKIGELTPQCCLA
jgi:hypothetical protein